MLTLLDMVVDKKFLFLASILLISMISFVIADETTALSTPTVCCEKLSNSDTFCINTQESQCSSSINPTNGERYKSAPTSCESTSYCRLGTCYDSDEGICMDNTPEVLCNKDGGIWSDKEPGELPYCQPGCCLIADQAAFVPLVRCKKLSSYFSVDMTFRQDITDEPTCIETANSQEEGACVFEQDFAKTCTFTTRSDCNAASEVLVEGETEEIGNIDKKFYPGILCSNERLGTECAKQHHKGCEGGKVYYYDSCGNRENVFSSNEDKSYNNGEVAEPEEVCSPVEGGSSSCGNCDYLLGSTCSQTSNFLAGSDYVCKSNTCTDRWNKVWKNGESWCEEPAPFEGISEDLPGKRYFRNVCIDGEIIVEPCSDFRNEVCYQGSTPVTNGEEYSTAACRINRWHDCLLQTEEDKCLDLSRRDCEWVEDSPAGLYIGQGSSSGTTFSNPKTGPFGGTGRAIAPITGFFEFGGEEVEPEIPEATQTPNREDGLCVPQYAPGLDFWQGGEDVCGQASAECYIVWKKEEDFGDLIGSGESDWKCDKELSTCSCEGMVYGKEDENLDKFRETIEPVCSVIGDCGNTTSNYAGYINTGGRGLGRAILDLVDLYKK